MGVIIEAVRASVARVLEIPAAKTWLAEQKLQDGEIVLINNSFLYRKVSTQKANAYLALSVEAEGHLSQIPQIATDSRLNNDLKRISVKAKARPNLLPLDQAIQSEISYLGHLVFILIGHLEDVTILEHQLQHHIFEKVIWDPQSPALCSIDGNVITIQSTEDEDRLWEQLLETCKSHGRVADDLLRDAFGEALDKLQDQAVAELKLPDTEAPNTEGMTFAIVEVLQEHRNTYFEALGRCDGDAEQDPQSFNEILRIAYNFATDAITYLRLIIKVCDLKPLILWGTIAEHFELSEAFKQLPWTRAQTKASIEAYISTISDARNSAFHHLFPFQKTLRVSLPEAAFRQAELRMFSEHAKKRENQLSYQDKELVGVLLEFTRARERKVSPGFWRKNLDVMDSTIRLFVATDKFLRLLHPFVFANPIRVEPS
jgi:hypothetical protein